MRAAALLYNVEIRNNVAQNHLHNQSLAKYYHAASPKANRGGRRHGTIVGQ